MPDDIIALRSELFATLRALRNPENPLDVDTARAVVEVGKAIIDSARVEAEMTRITGQQSGSGFVPPATPTTPTQTAAIPSDTTVTPVPGGRVVSHRLRG